MAGGTKRLPRAVREQQMLDAAVEVFSEHGYHDASMDAIAATAGISKPMVYLYYGSKDELFAACIHREGVRFVEAITPAGDPKLRPHEQLRVALSSFLHFVDQNRRSWQVLYRQAIGQQAFASQVAGARDRLIELTAKLLEVQHQEPGTRRELHDHGGRPDRRRRGGRGSRGERRDLRRRRRRPPRRPVLARPRPEEGCSAPVSCGRPTRSTCLVLA